MISLISQVTVKVLNYFFINPQESLYIKELVVKFDLDKRNLVKKLRELETEGILRSERRGNLKLYSINKRYPLYREYEKIILKTVGVEAKLKKIVRQIQGVKRIYIYGSYASRKMGVYSDIDLLVVGEHDIMLLQKELSNLQRELDREINVINMEEKEFEKRRENRDSFILDILKKKHIVVTA
ncbi:MAG: nucleotidyltransferase domain-containing protein [Candidatus Omnitrophica bacterium]|nr:nucleotidyltransferase domain-containing protein [Candidatus Omnitrophota bacterium]